MTTHATGWGTDAADQPLKPMRFERRDLRPNDVAIKITYAGICHSDLHTCRNDWGGTRYPVIPGHEIVGTVTEIGNEVTRHAVGDTVAVGCMVDSCMVCDQCLEGWEVFCREFGLAELAANPEIRTNGQRVKNRGWLIPRVGEVLKAPIAMTARSAKAATPTISSCATISC